MQVLVTGASGLLGTSLVRALAARGHHVRALVRRTSKVHPLHGVQAEVVHGDVRDGMALRQVCQGCELVFHTAAVFAYTGYNRRDMETTAREGGRNIIEASHAAGVRRVVLTSSTVTLGGNDKPEPLDESAVLVERGAPDYFITKASEERIATMRAEELGVDLVVANPSAFIGPFDGRVTPSLASITGYLLDPLKLTYTGGLNIAHVDDIAAGHILLAEQATGRQRYILGGENCTWRALHGLVADLCGVARPRMQVGRGVAYAGSAVLEWVALLTGKPPLATRQLAAQVGKYFWYDHGKAAALGYRPRPLAHTLQDTLPWLLASGELPQHLRLKLRANTPA